MLIKLTGSLEQRVEMRGKLFSDCDWMTWRHRDQIDLGEPTSLTEEQWEELLAYRAALRAWPVSGQYNEPFPAKPGWMTS